MAYCTHCQKRGHTLEQCYKRPKSFNPTKTFQKRHKKGPNGEIIIELVRRANKKDEIQLSPKHDITKITISPNNEKESNHEKSSIIQHKPIHSSRFNKHTDNQKDEDEIEIIKEVKLPVQPTTECKKPKSKPGSLPPITSSKQQVIQPKRTPPYISLKQPVIQPERIQYQSQVEKDRIIISAHNKSVMYMDMNKKLRMENNQLNEKINHLRMENKQLNEKVNHLYNRITSQKRQIDDMVDEINHITSLRRSKNKTVPTPGVLPPKHVRINLYPEDSE